MLNRTILILVGLITGVVVTLYFYSKRKPPVIKQPLVITLDGSSPTRKELPDRTVTHEAKVVFDVQPSNNKGGMILHTPSGGNIANFRSPGVAVFLDPATNTPTLIQTVSRNNVNKITSTTDIVTDGEYHTISMYLKNTIMYFEVDGQQIGTLPNLGGWGPSNLVFGEDGFSGTIKNIHVNDTLVTL